MASVVSLVIVVMGLLSVQFLPVAQFPEITPPVVQIDADYPGASAVVAERARAIEVQLPGIDNLVYFDSTSSNDGHVTIKLTLKSAPTLTLLRSKLRTAKTRRAATAAGSHQARGERKKMSPDSWGSR